jgi:DNA-binding NarL/FixJ family response regulator
MDTEKTSIWLFSQEPIFRDGLSRLLNSIDGFEVVGESNITEKLSSAVEIVLPNVAVVDVDINPESGFHLLRRLKQVSPTTSVIVMTSNFNDTSFSTL